MVDQQEPFEAVAELRKARRVLRLLADAVAAMGDAVSAHRTHASFRQLQLNAARAAFVPRAYQEWLCERIEEACA